LHAGTAETLARVVLLDGTALLSPKACGYAQIVVERPLPVVRGDRFIIRSENAQATLGGGEVVLPGAERHRRGDVATLQRLATIHRGTVADAIGAVIELSSTVAMPPTDVAERLNLDERALRAAIVHIVGTEDAPGIGASRSSDALTPPAVVTLGDGGAAELWTTAARWDAVRARIVAIVGRHHESKPLEPGVEMEAIRAQVSDALTAKVFRAIIDRLVQEGVVVRRESVLAAPSHRVELGADASLATRIETALAGAGYTPPDLRDLEIELGVTRRRMLDVLGVLEKTGRVVRVDDGLYYAAPAIARARAALEDVLAARATITAAEFRDRLGVSRKFSIALLDYFDRSGVTLRVGDARKLRRVDPA
jgi:selenocysteine-specific elongation factor